MRQLSALDRMFLTQETARAPMHISLLLFYAPRADGKPVRFRDIVRTFAERASQVPMLHQKFREVPLGLDNPYWLDDPQFNAESHLHHMALPQPGDWRQLCILLARLHARPIDRSRPLWEATIIEGLDHVESLPRGSFAMFLKVHHAAVDGVGGLHVIRTLHDQKPAQQSRIPATHATQEAPDTTRMLTRALLHRARAPLNWARLGLDLLPAAVRIARGIRQHRFGGTIHRSLTRFGGRISSHRVIESAIFEVEEINALRKAVPGCTLNDVVVSIIGGALRSYLQSCRELPGESLVTMSPLSLRDPARGEEGGNQVSAMAFAVHSDIEEPLARLRAVHHDSSRAKEMMQALGPRTALDLLEVIPPQIATLAFLPAGTGLISAAHLAMPVHTVVTNVPGPREPLYLCGAPLLMMAGFGPIMDSMGLFHAVMSCNGRLTIAINSCREMMPDPWFYTECIRAAFIDLQTAAGKAAKASVPRVKRRRRA